MTCMNAPWNNVVPSCSTPHSCPHTERLQSRRLKTGQYHTTKSGQCPCHRAPVKQSSQHARHLPTIQATAGIRGLLPTSTYPRLHIRQLVSSWYQIRFCCACLVQRMAHPWWLAKHTSTGRAKWDDPATPWASQPPQFPSAGDCSTMTAGTSSPTMSGSYTLGSLIWWGRN